MHDNSSISKRLDDYFGVHKRFNGVVVFYAKPPSFLAPNVCPVHKSDHISLRHKGYVLVPEGLGTGLLC